MADDQQAVDRPVRYVWPMEGEKAEVPGDDYDPCPMGCGNVTDDVAGGPCSECWDAAT